MVIDILIVLFLLSSLARGREIGFVRQLFSAVGFFGGLLFGAWLGRHFVDSAATTTSRAMITVGTTLGSAVIFLAISEYLGVLAKRKLMDHKVDVADRIVGAVAGGLTLLLTIWIVAPLFVSLPYPSLQRALKSSAIVTELNTSLPSAPNLISGLGRLIDPNGFPQVFIGAIPPATPNTPLPELGEFTPAIRKVAPSVVKIEGRGCGGIVEGSGFVAAKDFVVTNAHVIAGVATPYILDGNGTHEATAVWFDPDLDMAVLRANNLAGEPLKMNVTTLPNSSGAAVLGYPGGGNFAAKAATVIERIYATGRNIYDEGETTREVYELKADIIPGNSGGPLIDKDGTVRGLIFAQSTVYNQVGYALAMQKVIAEANQAITQNRVTSTGSCTE